MRAPCGGAGPNCRSAGKILGNLRSVLEPTPLLGQHTDEVLRQHLGMDEVEIAALLQAGAIGDSPNFLIVHLRPNGIPSAAGNNVTRKRRRADHLSVLNHSRKRIVELAVNVAGFVPSR